MSLRILTHLATVGPQGNYCADCGRRLPEKYANGTPVDIGDLAGLIETDHLGETCYKIGERDSNERCHSQEVAA